MAKQCPEPYVSTSSIIPHCIVGGCDVPVIAEVHDDDYSVASNLFRNKGREKIRTRRFGDERIYICAEHLDNDWRMAKVRWQFLIGATVRYKLSAPQDYVANLPTGGNGVPAAALKERAQVMQKNVPDPGGRGREKSNVTVY